MKEAQWIPCAKERAPDGVLVETKIEDANGVRNVQKLTRRGSLWWIPEGSMYVYYEPTHWRLP